MGTKYRPPTYFAPQPIQVRYGSGADALAAEIAAQQQQRYQNQRALDMQFINDEMNRRQRYAESQAQQAALQQQAMQLQAQRELDARNIELQRQLATQRIAAQQNSTIFGYSRQANTLPVTPVAESPKVVPYGSDAARIQQITDAKRKFVRSIWRAMQHHVAEADAHALVTAANDPNFTLDDVYVMWNDIQRRTSEREVATARQAAK